MEYGSFFDVLELTKAENQATYLNLSGRFRPSGRADGPPGEISIVRAPNYREFNFLIYNHLPERMKKAPKRIY